MKKRKSYRINFEAMTPTPVLRLDDAARKAIKRHLRESPEIHEYDLCDRNYRDRFLGNGTLN